MIPVVNWNWCDGCGKCIEVCPKNVLEITELLHADYKKLKWYGKFRVKMLGTKKIKIINASVCIGCRKCVDVCYESTINIIKNE